MDTTEERLGYDFKDKLLLEEALTHSSFSNEQHQYSETDSQKELSENYERLEFLGDAALDLVISDLLMEKFPGAQEGELSRIRAGLVNKDSLASMAARLSLGTDLFLGKGEETCSGRKKPSILAAVFEAVVGAVYLDGGYENAFSFISGLFRPLIDDILQDDALGDYKTPLQEKVQSIYKCTPVYRVTSEEGPDHIKIFEVEVMINSKVCASGKGKSKKEAEQAAAKVAIKSEFGDV